MKKKILFVINTLGRAGAERAMLELLQQFPPECYEISLSVILGQGELVHELPEHVKLLNTRYKDTSVLTREGQRELKKTVLRSYFCNGKILKKTGYIFQNLGDMVRNHNIKMDKLLWKILSDGGEYPKEEYDLAVAFLEGGATYFVAEHVRAKRKAAFVHIDYASAGYTRKLDQNCYLAYDRIFAVSDEVRENFRKVYPECVEKIFVFHNIINRKRILEKAIQGSGFTDEFDGIRLLTVGRLTYQKAYDIAIMAMKMLKDAGCPVRWYVLGEGDQREALEKQIKRMGLEQDFLLLGSVENPYPYYRQCDIYVHATRFEGKSIAIQEAQILGCAVIASDCNGNREQIVPGGDGMLCELSAEGICKSIIELAEDGEKRKRLAKAASEKNALYENEMNLLLELL